VSWWGRLYGRPTSAESAIILLMRPFVTMALAPELMPFMG
jgi:hypothetical protein